MTKAWVIVEELCVKVIDEVKIAEDAHTHYHTDDSTSDFMSTPAVALTTQLHLTSVKIARTEIEVWKSQTLPLPKTSNPLKEWRRGVKKESFAIEVAWCSAGPQMDIDFKQVDAPSAQHSFNPLPATLRALHWP